MYCFEYTLTNNVSQNILIEIIIFQKSTFDCVFIQFLDVFLHDITKNIKRTKIFDVELFIVSNFV